MFNHKEIESKWQKFWAENKTFKTTNDKDKKFYALDMFPYPSGSGLHVGHPEGYTATDAISRMKRMQGYDVLHPMGFDAFGLPAEQYAIKTGNDPRDFTYQNIDTFKEQLKSLGFSFDWDKQIETSNPEFYKWTQWIFTQLFEKGLAELKEVEVNWCDELGTVLANDETEEDENGNTVSERGGHPVTKKAMTQWVLNITKYADRLVKGLENINWPDSTKEMQKNWIIDKETGELNLRDWLFSRQRFWGEPFPVKYVDGKPTMLPLTELPLTLPKLKDFKGKDGKPPLANSKEWMDNNFDVNTMPGSAGSSWYFLAYILQTENGMIELNSKEGKELVNKWMPVDLYIGGPEHTVGHLLYARFWTMFLKDIGILKGEEPFQKLFHQGMILGTDGAKMSKSKGNVINPDDIVQEFGADTLRLYEMFMGALEDTKPWSSDGVGSSRKWLDRVYRLFTETIEITDKENTNLDKPYNALVKNVTEMYDELKYNTAISQMMVFINACYKEKTISKNQVEGFLKMLNPICPHITEELWEMIGNKGSMTYATWPTYDESKLVESSMTIAVQVLGKLRGNIDVDVDASKEDIIAKAKEVENVAKHMEGKTIVKEIYVPKKIVNFVVK